MPSSGTHPPVTTTLPDTAHVQVPRVLSIAGTDPSGGAGTAADAASIIAAGGYAMSVVTAVVAQNTRGVRRIHTPPLEIVRAQLEAVVDDVQVDAVKTGMLGTAEIVRAVADQLAAQRPQVLVIDPVMVASSGDRLLEPEAEEAMREFCSTPLASRCTVITPNIPELAVLTGVSAATDAEEALSQARQWAARTGVAVVVKTGHLETARTTNTWVDPDGTSLPVPSMRVETTSTHGTGCSLSSALATRLGAGHSPQAALTWATTWLHEAIVHGEALHVGSGDGHGPVDHSHRARRLARAGASDPWQLPEVPNMLRTPEGLADTSSVTGTRLRHDPAAPDPAAPDPVVAAVGPWTAALWRAGATLTHRVCGGDFVRALVDGSLAESEFAFYLAQDAQYLRVYSRALAALAAGAPEAEESADWAEASRTAVLGEATLHRDWLSTHPDRQRSNAMGPVTTAYTDFLLARTLGDDHVIGVAAVLPCYWLYAQVGADLPEIPDDHPYRDWLATYRDPDFARSTVTALGHLEDALAAAGPQARARAARTYLTACRHELEFFDQALRHEGDL
jgi:hydroxymethylpyrimidine/phosphomethylpyrimidine kinase